MTLTDYRADLDALLATSVDSSTWTTAIKDQALRMALGELDEQLVYEASYTVETTGYQQDLSSIPAIRSIVALAFPWQVGSKFGECSQPWRLVGNLLVYFEDVEPQADDVIRVRYTKLHAIESLDSAVATTAPEVHRPLVGLWAAAHACGLRYRQISENPALPKEAGNMLRALAVTFRQRAGNALSSVPVLSRLRWGDYGL